MERGGPLVRYAARRTAALRKIEIDACGRGRVPLHRTSRCLCGRGAPPPPPPRLKRESVVSKNADGAPLTSAAKIYFPGPRRKNRVIAPEPGPLTGPEPRPALAHDDLAARDLLAGEYLDAEHLRVRFAPVATGAQPLLMSHRSPPSRSVCRPALFWSLWWPLSAV